MKKFVVHIIFFSVPVLIILILIPVDKRDNYLGLKNDCFNHAIWIYDRMNLNKKPVDIVFLGSSHTINGIDDELISEILDESVVNFGYCRLGRNLHYILLKEILKQKEIKRVVIEVRQGEERLSHPVFPYLASDKDVFLPNLFFDKCFFSDLWKHFMYKVEMVQDRVYLQNSEYPYQMQDYGFASHNDTANFNILEEARIRQISSNHEMSEIQRRFDYSFARGYIRRIGKICRRKNIKLYFLYMPSYGTPYSSPKESETYKKYGKILIPPGDLYFDKNNWWDENHLNKNGARKIALWVADVLSEN